MSAIFTYNLNDYNNSFHSTPSSGAINNYINIRTIREFCFICQNFQNIITLILKIIVFFGGKSMFGRLKSIHALKRNP